MPANAIIEVAEINPSGGEKSASPPGSRRTIGFFTACAIVVANKIFWALGYWQVENFLTRVHPEQIQLDPAATIRTPAGVRRKWRRSDLDDVFRRAERSADGSYRAVAARAIPGRPVEGWRGNRRAFGGAAI